MPAKRPRVCLLIPSYHPLVGGAEIQLAGLTRALDRRRCAPFVLTRRLPGTPSAGMDGPTPVVRCAAPLRPATFCLSAVRYLWNRRREFDVLHVFSFDSPALVGATIKRLCPEKRYIQRIPRFGPGSAIERLQRSAAGRARLRFVLANADAVVPLNERAAGALVGLGYPAARIARIPNGVDTALFSPAGPDEKRRLKAALGIPEAAFVAIVVARLIPRKNVRTALEAWRAVTAASPGATLIVAGDGPEAPALSACARANLPRPSVLFTGNTPREEIVRLLKSADVYLSCSESEGLSNAMLEAGACGLPVVAAGGPGIDELVEHGRNGFRFDASRPSGGGDYLLRLAEDPGLAGKMAAAARGIVEERYAFDTIARRLESLYDGRDPSSVGATAPPCADPNPSATRAPVRTPPRSAPRRYPR